jgi:hypothetical protein
VIKGGIYLNFFKELASEIIKIVEHRIRVLHPEVEQHVQDFHRCDQQGNPRNTLLFGEGYYTLEEEVAQYIKEIFDLF